MEEEVKTIKQYAKEAKARFKNGFWKKYRDDLTIDIEKARKAGIPINRVKEYYNAMVAESIKGFNEKREAFYKKVKKILESEGEVSNAIGRLTDKEQYERLNYEEKQRYILKLSEEYITAVERYKKEKGVGINCQNTITEGI